MYRSRSFIYFFACIDSIRYTTMSMMSSINPNCSPSNDKKTLLTSTQNINDVISIKKAILWHTSHLILNHFNLMLNHQRYILIMENMYIIIPNDFMIKNPMADIMNTFRAKQLLFLSG